MKIISSFFFVLFVIQALTTFFADASVAQLRQMLADREAALDRLVSDYEDLETTRCTRLSSWASSPGACNVPSCGSTFSTSNGFSFKCLSSFGTSVDACGDCNSLIRSVNKSTVIFAPETDFSDKNVQSFLASGPEVETSMSREFNGNIKAWQGLGRQSGASRWFPGNPRERDTSKCTPYDPRIRSWYVAAASGPKMVVIAVDTSGSMSITDTSGGKTRMTLAKEAANAVLDTLTISDYFAIVDWHSTASVITNNGVEKFIRATATNVAAGKTLVNRMYAGGLTQFTNAFQKAFNVISNSNTAGTDSTGCAQNVIIFVTDGQASDSSTAANYVKTQRESIEGSSSKEIHVMTVTMSSGADKSLPRTIACQNKGIHSHVADGQSAITALTSYFKFLAFSANSTIPRYVQFYTDAFGLGTMTTVSRPFYDRSIPEHPLFVGVASIDLKLAEFTQYGLTLAAAQDELNIRSATCMDFNISDCQLQLLREQAGYVCPSEITPSQCRAQNVTEEQEACTTSISGGVNAMLCDSLNPSTMLAVSNRKTTYDVLCCEGCTGPTNRNTPSPNGGGNGGAGKVESLIVSAFVSLVGLLVFVF